jgi:hypothetical protein
MPAVVVDSVVVTGLWDPSALERGLLQSSGRLQQFVQQFATTPVALQLQVTGADRAIKDTQQQIKQLSSLGIDIPIDVAAFTAGLKQGVQEGIAEVQAKLQSTPLILAPPVIPPIAPPLPPDFSETIAETIRAADIMRAEFLHAFPVQALGIEAKQAATVAADALQAGLLSRVGEIRDVLSTGLISPTAAVRQVDLAIDAMAREIQAKQASLPALVLRTRGGQQDAGIITDADLAKVGQFSAATQQTAAATERLVVGSGNATRGLKTMAASMTSLAAQTVGIKSQIGLLLENFLFFSVGGPIVLGLAATALAATALFEHLSAGARKAKEDLDKATESLKHLRDQQRDPIVVAVQITGQAKAELDDVTARIGRLKAERDKLAALALVTTDPEALTALQGSVESLEKSLAKLGLRFTELGGLTAAGKLDVAQKQFDQLASAANQANQDLLSIQQVGFRGQQQALEAALAQDLITRRTFAGRSIQIAEGESAAVVKALKDQLLTVETRPTAPADRAAQKQEEDHLRSLIALEQAKLGLEVQRIRNQQTLEALASIKVEAPAALTIAPEIRAALIPLGEMRAIVAQIEANAARGKLDDEIQRALDVAEQLNPILEEIGLNLRDIGNANVDGTVNAFREMQHTAFDVIDGIGRIGNALEDVGLLSRDAARDFADLVDLGKSIASGDIAGIVSGGIHIIGDLVGPSEAERERNAILAQNNDLLRRNNAELANQQGGIGKIGVDQATLAALLALGPLLQNAGRSGVPVDNTGLGRNALDQQRQELAKQLAAAGIDLRAFAEQIKQSTGIEILDDKGRVVARAFDQAKEAIDRMVEAATHFGKGISDQQRQLETQAKLGLGGFSPDAQVSRLQIDRKIELDNLELDPKLEQKIRGLDLTTEAGRKAFFEFQQMLFEMARNGKLTAEQLGKFGSVDELLGPINDAADGINGFKDAVDAATKSLSDFNIPSGFKTAAFAFAAADPGGPGRPGDGAAIDFPPFTVPGRPTTHNEITVTFAAGSLVQSPGENADAFAERIVDALRVKVAAQSGGDSTLWGVN